MVFGQHGAGDPVSGAEPGRWGVLGGLVYVQTEPGLCDLLPCAEAGAFVTSLGKCWFSPSMGH